MYTTVFVNPNASDLITPELIKAIDLEGLAEALDEPMFYIIDDRRSRPERRAYRERNLKPWERTP